MTAPEWFMEVVPPKPMLSSNRAWHRQAASSYKRRLRRLSYDRAAISGLPVGLAKARIDVVLQFPTNSKRDTSNYHQYVVKPIVDGLGQPRKYVSRPKGQPAKVVIEPGYGTLLGDDPGHLHCEDCPHIRFGPALGRNNSRYPYGRITVHIYDLSHEVAVQGSLFEVEQ